MAAGRETDALVTGAGPFGLALAGALSERGVDHLVVGERMAFWREHMPAGMLLRSGADWHLDVASLDTLEAYLGLVGRSGETPIRRDTYLDYVDWFCERRGIAPLPLRVERLEREGSGFVALGTKGEVVRAREVVVAVGLGYFVQAPAEVAALLPEGSYSHTHETVRFEGFAGRRVVIVGGRQSAFEWAALLCEAGASEVQLVYRHATPAFVASDWTWVDPLVERMALEPGWFARADAGERDAITRRMWGEGRLKLEPWLAPRVVGRPGVQLWPESHIVAATEGDDGLALELSGGQRIVADHVLFATGYRVDMERVPFLAGSGLADEIATADGFPVLDEGFQSSVPGLSFTSMAAARDFGPFMGFTVSARWAATVIAARVADRRDREDREGAASGRLAP